MNKRLLKQKIKTRLSIKETDQMLENEQFSKDIIRLVKELTYYRNKLESVSPPVDPTASAISTSIYNLLKKNKLRDGNDELAFEKFEKTLEIYINKRIAFGDASRELLRYTQHLINQYLFYNERS